MDKIGSTVIYMGNQRTAGQQPADPAGPGAQLPRHGVFGGGNLAETLRIPDETGGLCLPHAESQRVRQRRTAGFDVSGTGKTGST